MAQKTRRTHTDEILPPNVVSALLKTNVSRIDSQGLLAAIIECFGGARSFARELFKEYKAAKAGSMTRQKFLELVTRLTTANTQLEANRPKPIQELSDDELRDFVQHRLGRFLDGRLTASTEEAKPKPRPPEVAEDADPSAPPGAEPDLDAGDPGSDSTGDEDGDP